VGVVGAFWGGFSSFFSIWQVCALQISPFFMAYIVGLHFAGLSKQDDASFKQWAVLPSLSYIVGFSILYSLLSSSGLSIGRFLTYNIGDLRFASGIYILFVSLYIILADRTDRLKIIDAPLSLIALSMLLGISFAIVYSPCITPTLSEILGLTNLPDKAVRGSVLALFYGLGLSLAFAVTGLFLVTLLKRVRPARKNLRLSAAVCGLILGILALLNITGLMTYYKAFVLGLLVE